MTTTELEAAEIYNTLVRVLALPSAYSKEAIAVADQLILDRGLARGETKEARAVIDAYKAYLLSEWEEDRK